MFVYATRMQVLTEVSGPPLTDVAPPGWIFERIAEWAKRFPDRFAFAVDHGGRVEEYRYVEVLDQSAGIAEIGRAHV